MPTKPEWISDLALDQTIPEEVNGRRNGVHNKAEWDASYHPCLEAFPNEDIARGVVTKFEGWPGRDRRGRSVYSCTSRDMWIYAPPGLEPEMRPRVILFNDGGFYLSRSGPVRATHVLDTLLHQGEIAPTVAVFIMPGVPDGPVESPIESYDDRAAQRSLEYDRVTPLYGEFLFGEVLRFAESHLSIKVSEDPAHRTVCGVSSGGIAAFNAAWHHPHQFGRVLSHCGSFTDIWGGHNYPSLVRRTQCKPIRVFLQSGENDANTPFGNWALANQAMASAFEWAGYDYRFEFGIGGHNLDHGGALFADSLRWLWR